MQDGRRAILYVTPFSQEGCGPDESLLPVVAATVARGRRAVVALPAASPYVRRYREVGARVVEQPLVRIRRTCGVSGSISFVRRFVPETLAIRHLLREEDVGLVHSNMETALQGAVAARLARVPSLLHYRGNTLFRPRPVFAVLVRVWGSLADRVVTVSEATRSLFVASGLGDKTTAVHNPVFVDLPPEPVGADGPSAGTVGRIHPRKRLHVFVAAAARVAEQAAGTRFTVIGAANAAEEVRYLADVRALAGKGGVPIRFVGHHPRPWSLMRRWQVFVMPAVHEGFGRVLVEAMAVGLPVVAARSGAAPEVLGDAGILVDPDDVAGFGEAVLGLLRDPAMRGVLGAMGRARYRSRYDPADAVTRTRALEEELLCAAPRR